MSDPLTSFVVEGASVYGWVTFDKRTGKLLSYQTDHKPHPFYADKQQQRHFNHANRRIRRAWKRQLWPQWEALWDDHWRRFWAVFPEERSQSPAAFAPYGAKPHQWAKL